MGGASAEGRAEEKARVGVLLEWAMGCGFLWCREVGEAGGEEGLLGRGREGAFGGNVFEVFELGVRGGR